MREKKDSVTAYYATTCNAYHTHTYHKYHSITSPSSPVDTGRSLTARVAADMCSSFSLIQLRYI